MHKKKADLDIILDLLKESLANSPNSKFIESLLFQYQERGSLSKKQLEGLHSKASKISTISPGKLATLEAIVLKMPTRYKSPEPVSVPAPAKDDLLETQIDQLLSKYPEHKRVLFIKMKLANNEPVSAFEKSEIARFHKLLIH